MCPVFRLLSTIVLSALFFSAFPADKQDTILHAAELTRLTSGCRIAAMGDAGVALPVHAPATFWNPATPGFLTEYEVWAEGAVLYGGLSKHAAGFAQVPLQNQIGIGAFYAPYFSGAIPRYDTIPAGQRSEGKPVGYFRNNQHLLALSVAKRFTFPLPRPAVAVGFPLPLDLGVGLSFKSFWQSVDPDGANRIGMNVNCDVGLLARIGLDYNLQKKEVQREVTIGVAVKNALPSKMVWVNSPYHYEEPVYHSEYYGIGYIDRSPLLYADWTIALSMHREMGEGVQTPQTSDDTTAGYAISYHGGIEAELWNTVFLRAGVSDRIPEVGTGIRYRNFRLDYAFRFDAIGYSPVRLGFGTYF